MTITVTLEYRSAGSDGEWTRMDPREREQWQWHDSPDWLAAEALWLIAEGDEVRLVTCDIDTGAHPGLSDEEFGDFIEGGSLSLNPPRDNPAVPAGSTYYGEVVAGAGKPNERPAGVSWPVYRHQRPGREHLTELNPGAAGKLRAWLTRPNGALTMGRVTFEAVAGGGILVRTQPYRSAS